MALLTTPDPATQGEVDQLIASYKAAGFDFVKVHDEDSLRYAYVVNAARAAGIPVAGHVPAGIPLATALAAHQRSIEHLTGYSEIVRSSSDIPTLVSATKQAGVWNCPTMLMESYNAHAITRDSMAQWPEARFFSTAGIRVRDSLRHYDAEHPVNATASLRTLALQRQLVKALQDSGARLLSGTDSPAGATVPGFSLHHELQALVLAGLTPYQALATSTRNVAMYFGTLAATGTVDVGKRADLLLLDANPLQDIRNTTRQSGVMIDGRWYSRDELDRTLAAVEGTLSYDWGYVH